MKQSSQRAWQLRKIKAGLCGFCGKLPLYSSVACLSCLQKRRVANRKRFQSKPWKAGSPGRIPLEKQ